MSSAKKAKDQLQREGQVHTLCWSDLPEGHGPPLALLRIDEHPEFPQHHHEFWEIVMVTSGTGLMVFGSKPLPIKVGDVFVIGRDQEHAYRETHSLDIINIAFDPTYIGSVDPVLEDWMSRDELFAVGPRWQPGETPGECLHLGPTEFARALDLAKRLEFELESDGAEARVAAFAYFLLLITLLRRHCLPREATGDAGPGTRVGRAVEFIENHFAEPITIDDIAACSHVSRRHFFRLFEQAVGLAPMEYLKKVRLQKAAAMLLTTNSNVTEVAFACGFNDSNYFSSLYHKEFGMSPSRFKRSGKMG